MELFSEIYSAYYAAVSEILSKKETDEKEMQEIIGRKAFSESAFFLLPKLKNEWGLLKKNSDGKYISVLKNKPEMPLTLLEKRWIKSLLSDEKSALFIDEKTRDELEKKLDGVEPLYDTDDFFMFDRFSDGDSFSDEEYIKKYRVIRRAIAENRVLMITFVSGRGVRITHRFMPFRLEYSAKNDKLRICAAEVRNGRISGVGLINMSRITEIKQTDLIYGEKADMTRFFKHRRCKEPVQLEIMPERNGVERFMTEFAGYEKRTETDSESGKCTAQLWYDTQDETELLIRLLSYGPVLEIKAPESFRRLAAERVQKQYKLLFEPLESVENELNR